MAMSDLWKLPTTDFPLRIADLSTFTLAATALFLPASLLILYKMGPARLIGHAKTEYHHSTKTITLRTEKSASNPSKQDISFPDLCRTVTPPCKLNPFLFNGHLQTLWTVVKSQSVPIHYRRRVFEHQDPRFAGQFTVDFAVSDPSPNYAGEAEGEEGLPERTRYLTPSEIQRMDSGEAGKGDSKPMLVVLHGLSGGSHELYLRHVLAKLLKPADGEVRWEACVINSRGCANSKITSSVLYNARATWDIRQTVKWLRRTFPDRQLFGIGFSLGANILTNYVGEEGEKCELKAAMVLSNPWNLEVGSLALQRSFLGLNVYSRAMGSNMKKLFEAHVEQISKNPQIDVEKVMRVKYLHDFDRDVQGPTWGYPTEGAYYRDASSSDSLLAIRIPFYALHARDDPIAVDEALPRNEFGQTAFGVLCTTSMGGHLSWFEFGGGRWFARVVSIPLGS
jgi:uncharacterized protein